MKTLRFSALTLVCVGVISAQVSTNHLRVRVLNGRGTALTPPAPRYQRMPPPLTLAATYSKAVRAMARATNHYHCCSATCLQQLPGHFSPDGVCDSGWAFLFSSTNGTSKNVYVYFDKAATVCVEDTAPRGF